jgi:hypothetical protein
MVEYCYDKEMEIGLLLKRHKSLYHHHYYYY